MPQYQTFPDIPGDSNSCARLASLPLPDLCGKSFLDVGCNEGFFCGYAFFTGARKVVGIDNNPEVIIRAKKRFPACEFVVSDWIEYLRGSGKTFDVILCASAIQYADDQPAFIAALVDSLAAGGLLILEMGIAPQNSSSITECLQNGWVKCRSAADEILLPTWQGMRDLLNPYAWKHVGESVGQKGDPFASHVFHVRRQLPYALFLFGEPGSGKTTAARRLFADRPVISGDMIWASVGNMPEKWPKLCALLGHNVNWGAINRLADEMFASGAWEEYAEIVAENGSGRDFVFEGYIPAQWREKFMERVAAYGYYSLKMETPAPAESAAAMQRETRKNARKYNMFLTASFRRGR